MTLYDMGLLKPGSHTRLQKAVIVKSQAAGQLLNRCLCAIWTLLALLSPSDMVVATTAAASLPAVMALRGRQLDDKAAHALPKS